MLRILYIFLALCGFFGSELALAAMRGVGGWTPAVTSTGQTIYYGPGQYQWGGTAQVANSIWSAAVPSASGAVVGWSGQLPFGGASAAVAVKGVLTAAAVFETFKTIAGGPVGIGIAAITAVPAIIDWLRDGGVRSAVTGSAQPFEFREQVCSASSCTEFRYGQDPWRANKASACTFAVSQLVSTTVSYTGAYIEGVNCIYSIVRKSDGSPAGTSYFGGLETRQVPLSEVWTPASIEDIRARMERTPSTSAAINAITGRGGSIPISYAPGSGAEPVTGPSSVSEVPVVTTSNDGTNTTTRTATTKTDLTYGSGTSPETGTTVPTVTGTSNTSIVTTVTNNSTGAVTTTNSTTNNPAAPAAPAPDPCAANPERVGCLDIDTPDGLIPKVDKNVSYVPESLFGAGSCPPDRTVQQVLTGRPVVLSYAPTCQALAFYVQPVIIAIALMMAYMIILPGNRE